MNKRVLLLSILSIAFLSPAGCGDYLDLEPDDPPAPDAAAPPADYPPLPPPEAFPDEPVVTTPGDAPAPPPGEVDEGVHLVFPPPVSITTARQVTVRGTARLAGGVTAVRVNGVDARLSAPNAQGAVAWQANVQITTGTSALAVSGEGGEGGITPAAGASITFSPDMLSQPRNLDLDVKHDRLFVTDALLGLVVIDLDTGASTSVRLGESPNSAWSPRSLSIAPAGGRAMTLSAQSTCSDGSILVDFDGVVVDLHDGTTTSVDEFEPIPDCASSLYAEEAAAVLDTTGESFYYLHYGYSDEPGRLEVRRRPLVDGGPAPMSALLCEGRECKGIDMIATRRDQPGQFGLLALVRYQDPGSDPSYAVQAIDPDDGSQTRVADVRTDWDGVENEPRALVINPDGKRLFVLAETMSSELHVIGVDLDTGAQSLYAGFDSVDGTDTWSLVDGIYDPRRDLLILSDEIRGLITLDLTNGMLDRLYRPAIGDGPVPACPLYYSNSCDISTLDRERQRLFVNARDTLAASDIYVLDLTTGNRRLLSPQADSTLELGYGTLLFADEGEDRLLVLNEDGLLYTVDGVTGERARIGSTSISALYDGTVAWDPAQNRILYFAQADQALHVLNVDTLEDRVISSDSVGSGPSLRLGNDVPFEFRFSPVLLDASGTRVFVSRLSLGIVFAVDLATGNRTSYAVDMPLPGQYVPAARFPVLADTHRNRILVGEHPRHTISAIDLTTGAITPFVDAYRTEPPLRTLNDLLPDHANQRALVVAHGYAVHMLDLQTGERVQILRNSNALPSDF